ncbi:MAG TPA: bifunctional oligoribonuclease/PAP phosphatase NrnA [Candidatus Limnocylindria bacterium]|nr:bifunctional oligoribonuclease/PAP phosphatase NrnA [Candidatus Limnocylindria bacterium]
MKEVIDAIRGAQRITVIGHENPDADTLGAALAIRRVGDRLGIPTEVVMADPVPSFLQFLPGAETVISAPGFDPDVAIIVDSGDLARIGRVATDHADWLAASRIVNIDHHVSNPGFGAVNHVDPEAASTCEMVALLLPDLGVELDAELATVLLAGIVNDTRTFAHPNVTPRTLRVAASLVEAGASLSAINRAIYAEKSNVTIAVWGRILGEVSFAAGGRIVHAAMTEAMLAETGATREASEGFIDLLGLSREADIVVLFKENGPSETRVSIRTSDVADAVAVASEFGGGGHARAAGCTVAAPLREARDQVLAACERELGRADDRRH